MDFIKELGALALGARLKRLVEVLQKDVKGIYQAQGVDYEFFLMPMMRLLHQKQKLQITQIAEYLGVSQPAVTHFCNALLKKGFIQIQQSEADQRKKEVQLTKTGKALLGQLMPLWEIVAQTALEIIDTSEHNFMLALENFEHELTQKDFKSRIEEKLQNRPIEIEIIDYQKDLKEYIKTLNEEWLTKYFKIEPQDQVSLSHPQQEIIDKGGYIYYAKYQSEIVGVATLLKITDTMYELGKMAVTEPYQGKGIGKKLLHHCIDKAKSLSIKDLIIYSNTKLTNAINLYFDAGFRLIPLEEGKYERANIKMVLRF